MDDNTLFKRGNKNYMKKITNKKGLEFSFSWLFALIVGAVILFLAIYAISKVVSTEETSSDLQTGKQIEILLNPLETGFEEATSSSITIPKETIIGNTCDSYGEFGQQIIYLSQESFGEFTQGQETIFENKYIFSEKQIQGKEFYLFSKPFDFPFKVSDLIYITPSNIEYCFMNAPKEIEKEIENLAQPNIKTSSQECSETSIKVCFTNTNCEISVNYNSGRVFKSGKVARFETDALMYAAIFSDKNFEIYECQLKRLMKRISSLSSIYIEKDSIISKQGCDTNLNLAELKQLAETFQDSSDLPMIYQSSADIQKLNDLAECKLW